MNDLDKFRELKENQKNTYRADINCLNCGDKYSANIPKGTPIQTADPACPKCGCSPNQISKLWGNQVGSR